MAATAVVKTKSNVGAKRRVLAEVTLDNSSPEGGYEVKPSLLGMRVIDDAQCTVKSGSEAEATTVGSAYYVPSTKKLVVNDYKTQKPIAKEKDLSKVVVIMEAWGR